MESKARIKAEIERLTAKVPADLARGLASSARAKATWDDITPLARRDWILWVVTAKLAETRERRIKKGIDMLSKGKRRPCCFGGAAWIMKAWEGSSSK
jgi:uncharacterized protein YdeI (YjbR/CyaY-like superfamily)